MAKPKTAINPKSRMRLRRLLDESGMRQSWLQDQINLSGTAMSKIMTGKAPLTEKRAKEIANVFTDGKTEIRYEWLMGYDDFKTKQEKTVSEQRNERAMDLLSVATAEGMFSAKMAALKAYFRLYALKTVPDCEWLIPDRLFQSRDEWEAKHRFPGYFPENAVREGTEFRITGLFDDEKVYGECTGTQLIELAERLFEFADFELHKFARQAKNALKSEPNESETEEPQ